MNITATIQARMGSSRLPGKVLADICGKPMLLWQVERIRKCRLVDRVVIGTSISVQDDQIEEFCKIHDIECYRGSEDDVLGRIASLLRDLSVDIHIECYGDSPLVDPQIIDEFVGYYLKYKSNADYISSAMETSYPPGLEVTIYPAEILIKLNEQLPHNDPNREHVGYNITRFPKHYRLQSLTAPPWLFAPDIYLEVDTNEDLMLIRAVVGHFVRQAKNHFSLSEILYLLNEKPELKSLNNNVNRRWKELRELKHV